MQPRSPLSDCRSEVQQMHLEHPKPSFPHNGSHVYNPTVMAEMRPPCSDTKLESCASLVSTPARCPSAHISVQQVQQDSTQGTSKIQAISLKKTSIKTLTPPQVLAHQARNPLELCLSSSWTKFQALIRPFESLGAVFVKEGVVACHSGNPGQRTAEIAPPPL
jgi:hypothetical protein